MMRGEEEECRRRRHRRRKDGTSPCEEDDACAVSANLHPFRVEAGDRWLRVPYLFCGDARVTGVYLSLLL
jgi:hypothetical protein